jgi:hypothetical protein
MILHAAGAVAVLAWIIIGFTRLARIARGSQKITGSSQSEIKDPKSKILIEALARLSKRLDIRDEVDLLITDEAVPPVAYWLLRPKSWRRFSRTSWSIIAEMTGPPTGFNF